MVRSVEGSAEARSRPTLRRILLALALTFGGFGCEGMTGETELPGFWTEPSTGMEFVLIPAGRFVMGSPHDEVGREAQEVQHEVEITRSFYLGRTEVTQQQWRQVMGENPSTFTECGPDCPVEEVNWLQASEFLDRLGAVNGEIFRLPTEAEWEYACRAGTTTAFHSGDVLSTDQANYDGDPPVAGFPGGIDRGRTLPVATFEPNAWGLHDMHGNVWEFTRDWHCPYQLDEVIDPLGRCDSGLRVIRGGSWHFGADSARCALRYTHTSIDRGPSLGFRALREVVLEDVD